MDLVPCYVPNSFDNTLDPLRTNMLIILQDVFSFVILKGIIGLSRPTNILAYDILCGMKREGITTVSVGSLKG